MRFNPVRWAGRDRDRYLGPFTYTPPEPRHAYRSTGVVLGSGGDEDENDDVTARSPGVRLRVELYGHALHVVLPRWVLRPYRWRVRARWDAATVARLGRDHYWRSDSREFGVTYAHEDGALHLRYGRQSDDSSTERSRVLWVPWRRWRVIRHVLLDSEGNPWCELPGRSYAGMTIEARVAVMDEECAAERACPARYFALVDCDGEYLTCRVRLEEITRRRGEGRWRWLGALGRPRTQRRVEVEYSGEQGRRKGSWKGGTLSCSAPCADDADHDRALRALHADDGCRVVGAAPAWLGGERPTRGAVA